MVRQSALTAIFAGVVCAGVIMTSLTLLGGIGLLPCLLCQLPYPPPMQVFHTCMLMLEGLPACLLGNVKIVTRS